MEPNNFNLTMDTVRPFFQNQGTFFDLQKKAGEAFPTSPHSCMHAIILKKKHFLYLLTVNLVREFFTWQSQYPSRMTYFEFN